MGMKLAVTLREDHRLHVLRTVLRMFGPRRDIVIASWRTLFHNVYISPNISRMIKSRRIRWAEH
jgi:hypothetical protein